jgi:hypothetical protein
MMGATDDQRRENFAKLAAEIDTKGGVATHAMKRLRDAHLDGKLGVNSVVLIQNQLKRAGIGVLSPTLGPNRSLPREQNAEVILFTEKSKVGQIVEAVRRPTAAGVRALREVANTNARETLDQIRDLIADTDLG